MAVGVQGCDGTPGYSLPVLHLLHKMLLLLLLWWSPGQVRAGQPDPVAYLKQFGYISSGGDMPGGQGG